MRRMELSVATSILSRTPIVLEPLLAGLTPEWLQRNDGPGTWSAHDLTHIGQVSEVLARRYREDVGPWRAYMPALDRVAAAE